MDLIMTIILKLMEKKGKFLQKINSVNFPSISK